MKGAFPCSLFPVRPCHVFKDGQAAVSLVKLSTLFAVHTHVLFSRPLELVIVVIDPSVASKYSPSLVICS